MQRRLEAMLMLNTAKASEIVVGDRSQGLCDCYRSSDLALLLLLFATACRLIRRLCC